MWLYEAITNRQEGTTILFPTFPTSVSVFTTTVSGQHISLLLTLIYGLIRTLVYISSKHKMFSLKCKPAFWLDLTRVTCFCDTGCVSDVFFSSPPIAHLGLTIKLTIKLHRELESKGPTLYSFSNLISQSWTQVELQPCNHL